MRTILSRLLLMTVVSFSLAACAQMNRETTTASASQDDDATCRNSGQPGSDGYAACMKNRDVAREQSQGRRDRTHKRVAEDMLNGR